ncbi:MAG: YicC family protein [Spirochaetes bacterium]|nr:YicC family protein [Spirochaetota bacterium]MBN2770907.1 YicC family protein [Spirochaetota bacterium]
MESMTGYASVEGKTEQFSFSIEVKTLNTKFLEIYINLPRIIRQEENAYSSIVKEYINRGKVEVNFDLFDWNEERQVSVNTALIKAYYDQLLTVESKIIGDRKFNIDAILGFDGVVAKGRTSITPSSFEKLTVAYHKALKNAVKMRREEGKSIEKDILLSIKNIGVNVQKITKLTKNSALDQYQKLKERVSGLVGEGADTQRLYTEFALLSDRLDINEELSRLKDHMAKFKNTCSEKGPIGKKLDFIAQEMFREINTIASKSNRSDVAHCVVDVKNLIDKIREQCRNVV